MNDNNANKQSIAKKVLDELNIFKACKVYGVSIWQCPNFLFPLVGLITVVAMIGTYLIASAQIIEPEVAALIVAAVTTVIFTLGHFIVIGFSKVAEANRLKSEFVSIVSHQLRTPLTGLRWSLNALMTGRYGLLNEKQNEFFEIIKESTERMLKLVNNLLDVSRVEANSIRLDKCPISLSISTGEVLEDLLPVARASNIDIKIVSDNGLPDVNADAIKLRIIIQNLLDNAIKYIKGSGRVDVKIYKEGSFVVWKVSDTGVGIPEEEKKQIFQKFFRSRSVLRQKTEGTGLGLFITKAYVEAMGGKMDFDSKVGHGTTFWFSVPIFTGNKEII